jgi:hypothetical protein
VFLYFGLFCCLLAKPLCLGHEDIGCIILCLIPKVYITMYSWVLDFQRFWHYGWANLIDGAVSVGSTFMC